MITLDQKQKHVTGPAELGDMAALKKIAKGGIESAADFLKSFSDKTYYHGSATPDIKKFDPYAESPRGGFEESGATFFSTSEDEARFYINDLFEKLQKNYVSAPVKRSSPEAKELMDEYGNVPSLYEVKIKESDLFDPKNQEHLERLYKDIGSDISFDDFKYDVDEVMENAHYGEPNDEFYSKLKESGFRGFKPTETEVGLFYPDKGDVRSVHAKFDPEQAKSGNILASVPVGYGALNMIGEENGKNID